MRILLTALALAALTVATGLGVVSVGFYDTRDTGGALWWAIGGWVLFAVAVWLLRGVGRRAAVVLIVVGAVALGGAAMIGPPTTSTDSARYAWDGIVQVDGHSPYDHVPRDQTYEQLRPAWLFPDAVADDGGHPRCPYDGERISRTLNVPDFTVLCTTINRPTVPTIYPPTAELYFAGVRALVPPEAEYWPFQAAGALASLAVTLTLLVALRRRGLDPRWAALWAWCPFVLSEAVTNSHVDVLGALLVLAATLLVAGGRRLLGGVALGAAIGVKLIPVIAAPALLKRQPWKVVLGAVVTFALLYVPYVLQSGLDVIGYLPGYLSEEGYDDGTRFALLSLVAPGPASVVLAALVLGVLALLVYRRTDPASPWLGQLVMIGGVLLVVTPHYSWYALLLVPFVAMTGRWEWLTIPLALSAGLLIPELWVARLTLAAALAVVLVISALRRRDARGGPWRLASAPLDAAASPH
ncbi:glycosyltransferase family 87 protein [Herbiconiux solani]|uniref:glycosyltransferase family 87 protein n=1 Tax=Herbiconiux solani TaxID=661329 RepID=UPI00082479D4|nr:glycosyltransferase family 87 protein [Herbiconiux solani]